MLKNSLGKSTIPFMVLKSTVTPGAGWTDLITTKLPKGKYHITGAVQAYPGVGTGNLSARFTADGTVIGSGGNAIASNTIEGTAHINTNYEVAPDSITLVLQATGNMISIMNTLTIHKLPD